MMAAAEVRFLQVSNHTFWTSVKIITEVQIICENCEKDHDGSYGSGRFCSSKCARGFSTKAKRKEINDKVSLKLGSDGLTKRQRDKQAHASFVREQEVFSILDVSSRTARKILLRMELKCSNCGWDEEVGDIHHIVPTSKGGTNEHTNLTYLCPNCHRLAGKGKLNSFVNLWDYIGNTWKEFYYVKNGKLLRRTK
jgi:rubredoxin